MTWVDHIPGGLADEKSPDDFDLEALAKGTEVELEHTDDPQLATEVAMDHLTEDPKYYDKLEVMEKTSISLRKSVQAFELRLAVRNLVSTKLHNLKRAADEIDLHDLPPDRMRLVKKVPYRAVLAWSGIHGYIVEFDRPAIQGGRFNKAFLKDLVSDPNFRWIESQRGRIAIGM